MHGPAQVPISCRKQPGARVRLAPRFGCELDPRACPEHALRYPWAAATGQFLEHLVPVRQGDLAWAAATPGT